MDNPEQEIKACVARGDLERALKHCQSWLKKLPHSVTAWHHTAIVYELTGNIPKANLCVETALELNPDRIGSLAMHAKLLTDKRAICEISSHALSRAKAIADKFIPQAVDDPAIHRIFSSVYRQVGDFAQAIAWLEQAALLDPLHAQLENDLGVLYQLCNQRHKARTHLERALELDPLNFLSCWQIAQLDPPDDKLLIQRMRAALVKNPDSVDATIYLGFALARLQERKQNYKLGFQHLEHANAAVKLRYPYSVKEDEASFQQIEQAYPRELFADRQECAEIGPIFVLGLPRTGTTLVEQLICASDQVTAAGELLNFRTLADAALRSVGAALEQGPRYEHVANLDHQLIGELYLQSCEPLNGGSPSFVDKYPFNFPLLGEIALALSSARFVHVQRNPMDTCLSNYKHLFRPGSARHSYNLDDLAHYYLAYRHLMDHWQQCLPARIHTVCYDTLVREPREEAGNLMAFLNIPWREEFLNFYQSTNAVATPSAAQVRKKIYPSSSLHWKKYPQELGVLADWFVAHGVEIEIQATRS